MMNPTIPVKKIIAAAFYHGGFINILRSLVKDGVIVGYHRILPSDSPERRFVQPGMYVTLETFEKHISYLSKNYTVLGLEDIGGETALRNTCAVTFDDGWADTYKYAFPVLKRHGIPATVFLATNKVGTRAWPWPDRVCHAVHTAGVHDFVNILKKGMASPGMSLPGNIEQADNTLELSENILELMKKMSPAAFDSLLDHIDRETAEKYGAITGGRPWLTWDEVEEMSRHGISFGAHTHNHVLLTNIPLADARSEMLLSREILSEKIGKPVRMFCYPNGFYNHEIMGILRECGYDMAVTTKRGSIRGSESVLNLNRIMIHEDMTSTIPMFACVLTGRIPYF